MWKYKTSYQLFSSGCDFSFTLKKEHSGCVRTEQEVKFKNLNVMQF